MSLSTRCRGNAPLTTMWQRERKPLSSTFGGDTAYREWRQNLRDVGGSTIDQVEWFGFKHETKEFLIWFCLQHNLTGIESFI